MARKSINEYLRKIALAVNPGAVADKRRQSDNEYVRRIAEGVEAHADEIVGAGARVSSLDETVLATGTVVDVTGIPTYVADVADYDEWGIEETGWYVFARVLPRGTTVSQAVTVDGAAGYVVGADHIDLAVRFEVAAQSCPVTIHWGDFDETIVFRATDLAVRNLDYRTTFYVYDLAPFVTWEYTAATDVTFVEGKQYYVRDGDSYALVVPTAGDTVPTVYYEQHVSYDLTTDATFASGKTYYVLAEGEYVAAEVTEGEEVTPDTYYVQTITYTVTEDVTFQGGKTYHTKSGTTYSAAEVTEGEEVPTVYYVHSKMVVGSGLTRNVTYRLDVPVDCPSEFILPEVEDDEHGCWYEMRFMHTGSYSSVLTPSAPDVVVATQHTQAETEGINMIDLHYSAVAGHKVWRFMNTHSTFTKVASPLVSIAFRTPPTITEYEVGGTLDTTGAVVVATYEDGHTKIVTPSYAPANGATLTAEDTELVASLTVGDVTATATTPLTVTEAQGPEEEGGE